MTHDSRPESPGISRRIFLGFSAAVGAVAYLTLRTSRADAAPASPPSPQSDGAHAQRPHHTLLGLL